MAPKCTEWRGQDIDTPRRDHLSLRRARACCHTSRERRAGAAQSSMGLYAKVPSAGAGATRCAWFGHAHLSTTASVLSVQRPDASSKLLRCSGAAMTSSAWALARRGRCGPCTALMTKKVEEGRRQVARFVCMACKFRAPPRPLFTTCPYFFTRNYFLLTAPFATPRASLPRRRRARRALTTGWARPGAPPERTRLAHRKFSHVFTNS